MANPNIFLKRLESCHNKGKSDIKFIAVYSQSLYSLDRFADRSAAVANQGRVQEEIRFAYCCFSMCLIHLITTYPHMVIGW